MKFLFSKVDDDGRPSRVNWKRLSKHLILWSDVVVFLILVGVAFALFPRTRLWYGGLTLAAMGFFLAMIARWQLGASFSLTAQARQLVMTGFYRRIRHPIYLFGMLAYCGVFLAMQNWWILGVWFAYASLIQWRRAIREDHVLREAFGETFEKHRKNAWI